MKQKFTIGFKLIKLPILATVSLCLLASLAVFAGAERNNDFRNASLLPDRIHPSRVAARAVMRVTLEGARPEHTVESKVAPLARPSFQKRVIQPAGNTLWMVDDQNAIADGVSIDAMNVWTAWTLTGARLSIYPINGNGTEAWHFSSFNSGNTGVAAAKNTDRLGFMESNAAGNDFRQHAFTSNSNGTPDWSFPYPVSDPNLPANSRKVATSRDGSTIAAVVSDSVTQNSILYVFEAATGAVRLSLTDSLRMNGVELTDNGSVALVTEDNLAKLVNTTTGDIVFSVAGSGAGNIFYRISGDGQVFVTGGFSFDVYAFNGTTYTRVIHFGQANFWFGGACAISRDGSTVGTFGSNYVNNWLNGVVYLFDVASGNMLGSYPVSGSGMYQGTPVGAGSNDNGSVMAFASWGTEFHDWPEVMVFDRSVQLIGQIDFPGSAFSVDVSSDGQYVVGGSKAVHANQFGSGGRVELIQLPTTPTPTPTATPTPTPTATVVPRSTATPRPRPTPAGRP